MVLLAMTSAFFEWIFEKVGQLLIFLCLCSLCQAGFDKGETWLCLGQSNMSFPVGKFEGYKTGVGKRLALLAFKRTYGEEKR